MIKKIIILSVALFLLITPVISQNIADDLDIPSGYKILNKYDHYVLLGDKKGVKKMFINKTKKLIKFSSKNQIRFFDGDLNYPFVTVATEKSASKLAKQLGKWEQNNYIYSRKTGKLLHSKANYGIAVSVNMGNNVFFVKSDTPNIPKSPELNHYCEDTLRFEDDNWFMYSSKGKLLNQTPFRFPIDFKYGLGVGMQGEKMNIWRTNGETLLPINYDKVWRHNSQGFYYIFEYKENKLYTTLINNAGKQIFSKQYDDISVFWGKYAFFRIGEKIGLVDTSGNEVIAPQDLKSYKGNLIDTFISGALKEEYAELKRLSPAHENIAPFYQFYEDKVPYDSINVPISLQSQVHNLMLETYKNKIMVNKMPHRINRLHYSQKTYQVQVLLDCYRPDEFVWLFPDRSYYDVQTSKNNISFLCSIGRGLALFANYIPENNAWKLLDNKAYLNLTEENQIRFYNLIVGKIKKRNDIDFDFSNRLQIIQQAQTQFLLKSDGMRIFFKSQSAAMGYIPISLSKAELEENLKP